MPRRFVLLASVAICLTLAHAQEQNNPETAKSTTAVLEGRVVRATDGLPLRKAVVTAFSGDRGSTLTRRSAMTNQDGKFVLENLPAGHYSVSAIRSGYVRSRSGRGSSLVVTIAAGQRVSDVVLRLAPGAVITGRIVDEDGEPMENVHVSAMRWAYTQGQRQLVPTGNASTDDRGEYRIHGLPLGRYFVSATYNPNVRAEMGMISWTSGPGDPVTPQTYAPTYYPGTNDVSQATAIQVKAGEEYPDVNIQLTPARAVRVSGIVRNNDGKPAKGAMLELTPSKGTFGWMNMKHGVADEKGAFEIDGVTPGAYVLSAESQNDSVQRTAEIPIEASGSDIDSANLVLREGTTLQGRITVEGSLPPSAGKLSIGLRSSRRGYFGGASAKVNDDLTFSLSDVGDGEFHVNIYNLPLEAYIKAVRIEGRDVKDTGFRTNQARGRLIEILISTNAGRVEGSVTDKQNQPFAGARVVLVPDAPLRNEEDLFRNSITDQYGRYSIRGVPPGTYKVLAWDGSDDVSPEDPDFLKQYEDLGVTVRVGEGTSASVDVKVISSAKDAEAAQ